METGELLIGGSTAGAIVPAGLTLAAKYFGEPKYLKIARELGEFMLRQFVARGLTTGGPGEALAAPDSESSYALLKSFVTLYEATGDQIWVDAARDMTQAICLLGGELRLCLSARFPDGKYPCSLCRFGGG